MIEIDITEADVLNACLDSFKNFPVVMIQFPEVFGLMALPAMEGVHGLNRVKSRLPDKLYGSVIGNIDNFFRMHTGTGQTDYLAGTEDYQKLEGSIIRIRISETGGNSPACREGTHQSLLLEEGPVRSLFRQLEKAFEAVADPSLFLGHRFSAPLCTSANLSGHPKGSITNLEIARDFGSKKGIPLLIRSAKSEAVQAKGSYPVLFLEKTGIIIERKGPGLEEIMAGFPPGLFSQK